MPDGSSPPSTLSRLSRLYEEHVGYVWRNLRRLGVPEAALDDATQEVFVVVLRRWRSHDPSVPIRAWLFGILRRVASRQRRALARRSRLGAALARESMDADDLRTCVERRQGIELVERFLASLPDDKREVFVLAELEQMSAREIGLSLGLSPNTAASRLRGARRAFDRWFATLRARERRVRTELADESSLLLTRVRSSYEPDERAKRRTWQAIVAAAPSGAPWVVSSTLSVGLKLAVATVAVGTVGLGIPRLLDARRETPTVAETPGDPTPAVAASEPSEPIEPRAAARLLELRNAASEVEVQPASEPRRARRVGSPTMQSTPDDPLAAEAALVERARAAVKRGEPSLALELLERHEREFPDGRLNDERRVTRVLALCSVGKKAQARGEAQAYARQSSRADLAQRLVDACPLD